MPDELLALAERCEKAKAEEQRELLEWVWQEINGWPVASSRSDDAARFIKMLDAEAYESAAMVLVPEGALWDIFGGRKRANASVWTPGCKAICRSSATPALALVAACCRAHHAMKEQEGG